jgi:hypothetical protein
MASSSSSGSSQACDDPQSQPSLNRKHKRSDQDQDPDQEQDQEEQEEQEQEQEQDTSYLDWDESQSPSKVPKHIDKKPNLASPSLRKEQNRAAQRAFRDRKERHLQQLENMIRDLKQQQLHITVHFQREVQQLKTQLETTNNENYYLREVVFAFETTLSKGGHATVLQDVKQKLFQRYKEKQAQSEAITTIPISNFPPTSTPPSSLSPSSIPTSVPAHEPPHPLTMTLSKVDPSYEMGLYTTNREILYRAPPLFVSVAPEDGQVLAVKSPMEPLAVSQPSYSKPGTHLPKHTDYTKHPTVFDELQSSLFPPGTLQSLVHSGMATPQEVVNDNTPFDQLQENGVGEPKDKADLSKWGIHRHHRLHKEMSVLASSPPAMDPNISPQIYQLPHDPRIDLVPCPKLRAQMILHQNKYDLDELFQLLINKSVCHGHPLDVSNWELPDEFFDRFGFLIGLDMERLRRKVWPRKPPQEELA